MRRSPSIIPSIDQDVFLVVDDFGSLGQAWRETNVGDTDLEMVICDLLEGQYHNPVMVVGFNVAEGWCRDVSEDVADELRKRCADQKRELPPFLEEFVERHAGKRSPDSPCGLGRPFVNDSMEHKGVRYAVLQTEHPSGWKWVAHVSPIRQTTGFSSHKEIAIQAAKRAIEKALEDADDER